MQEHKSICFDPRSIHAMLYNISVNFKTFLSSLSTNIFKCSKHHEIKFILSTRKLSVHNHNWVTMVNQQMNLKTILEKQWCKTIWIQVKSAGLIILIANDCYGIGDR